MNLPVRPIRDICEKVIAVEINSIDSHEKVSNMIHMSEPVSYTHLFTKNGKSPR